MRLRREVQEIGLSFLDVICCGFGAIILLLMITKVSLPTVLEESIEDLISQVAFKRDALEQITGEVAILERAKVDSELNLEELLERLTELKEELDEITSRYEALRIQTEDTTSQYSDLLLAKQTLTDEMERLLGQNYQRRTNTIGGVTVDSEYIIFVIDTSGSMQTGAWGAVVRKVTEVLNIYPNVKGIQVMNDMGDYMFPRYRGQWIQDTPGLRDAIVNRLRSWTISSNSSPVEGIEEAIKTYYDKDKNISIYVFGDDFQGRSVEDVVDRVDLVNVADADGNRRVRIHAIGFPVYFDEGLDSASVYMFSLLMKELTIRNNGTFVGLPAIN